MTGIISIGVSFLRFVSLSHVNFQECINAAYLSTGNDLDVSTCLSSNLASLLEGCYLYCGICNRGLDPFRDPGPSRIYHLYSWLIPFVCLFRSSSCPVRDPDACRLWISTGNENGCGIVSASSGGDDGDCGDEISVACPCPAYPKGSTTATGKDFPLIWNSFSLSSRDSFHHL